MCEMEQMTVRELRMQTGMTQNEFARYFGMPKQTLCGWEYGKKAPGYFVPMAKKILENDGVLRKPDEKVFVYQKYHFKPLGYLMESMTFREVMENIRTCMELGFCTFEYEWTKQGWDMKEFYNSSTDPEADIFLCLETRKNYLPGKYELFEWIGQYEGR